MIHKAILLILTLSLTSCGYLFWKEIKCREFKAENLSLFPGQLNDTISFADKQGNVRHFIINDKRAQHTTRYISDTGCSCHDFVQMLYISGQDSIWTKLQLNYIYDQKEKQYFEVWFVLDNIKNGFTEVYQDSTFTGIQIEGNNYSRQRKYIWNDPSDKNIVKECIIADNIGLLRFEKVNGDIWTRVNIKELSTSIETLDFSERTCD
ncbi:MAG: hypothetical protein QY309_13370 [Cyclobacteriaceae bacterium]|nr:MAG: hypothetical protein QY309_13370 [Cyclobacteriaceae bacterium]